MAHADDDERQALLHCLAYQRSSVLSILDGLDVSAWQRSVVPSAWTPAGLLQHLGDVERHWFLGVAGNADDPLPWDDGRPPYDPHAPFMCDRPPADIVTYYREQCARADDVLAATPLSAAPLGRHGDPAEDEPPTLRWIILHVIEETAAHSGHLELAREILDGTTAIGLR